MFLISDSDWAIRQTQYKGRGVFAKQNIPIGLVIGDYIGIIIRPQSALTNEENLYLMYYHDHAAISPDSKMPGVHLLNHSCIPNCWLYTYKGHTLVFALRPILKDEEMTISYLLPPRDEFCQQCQHICKCQNLHCEGTMHMTKVKYNKWKEISNTQTEKTKKLRIRYGKMLPLLKNYPKKISREYIGSINKILDL